MFPWSCKKQRRAERLFVYEHPQGASSWELESVAKMRGHENVYEVKLHMCAFDMKVSACQDDERVFKPTRVLTNSRAIAESISRRCQGGHRHHHLLRGKAWEAAIYPPKFCQALLRGIHIEKEARKKMYANVACYSPGPEDLHDSNSEYEIAQQHASPIEGELDPRLVCAARKEEMNIFDLMGVYERVPREDLFAGTPPLMTLKLLLALLASSEGGYMPKDCRAMILDVKRAFLYGETKRDIYMELPPEDPMYGKGFIGRLRQAMYGTPGAPQVWQETVRRAMESLGYEASRKIPCVYFSKIGRCGSWRMWTTSW